MTFETGREALLRAFLALLAERPYERIDMAEVASAAGLSLAEVRAAYADKAEILAAFFRATDRQVLAEGGPDDEEFAGENAKERLFEVLMRRLDALEPHKAAVRSLATSARRDPRLALQLLRLSEASQRWMLAAAGIACTGLAGSVRAKGLALLFARLIEVWLEDEDPGLSATMAALDRELDTGGKLLGMLDDLAYLATPWRVARNRVEKSAPEPTA